MFDVGLCYRFVLFVRVVGLLFGDSCCGFFLIMVFVFGRCALIDFRCYLQVVVVWLCLLVVECWLLVVVYRLLMLVA